LGISTKAFETAILQLVANAETDTMLVMSARIPESAELEQLYRYAYDGRSIDF
jgi:hypothetical protein